MEIICVRTGDKYGQWWEDNLKYMLDNIECEYEAFNVIHDERYDGYWNKLQMFEQFRDNQYLYFDLDVVIRDKIDHLLRQDLTVLRAWWREVFHTPLNSSIISWKGDRKDVFDKFNEDPEYFMLKYVGCDDYFWHEISPKEYEPVCNSYRFGGYKETWPVVLFNQRHEDMKENDEWSKYLLSE